MSSLDVAYFALIALATMLVIRANRQGSLAFHLVIIFSELGESSLYLLYLTLCSQRLYTAFIHYTQLSSHKLRLWPPLAERLWRQCAAQPLNTSQHLCRGGCFAFHTR